LQQPGALAKEKLLLGPEGAKAAAEHAFPQMAIAITGAIKEPLATIVDAKAVFRSHVREIS